MSFQFQFPLTISLACLLLVSCATVEYPAEDATLNDSPVTDDESTAADSPLPLEKRQPLHWQEEKQRRQQIRSWEIRGRLGVQTAKDAGVLDLIWKQSADEYSIRLIAPLASGNYHIQGDGSYAEIRYPDGSRKNIENIDDMFLLALEVDLPASAIKDWLRGLPASELVVDDIQWNESGQIHEIRQDGWNVEMEKYAGTKLLLPHAIYITRDDDEDLDIQLLLRQWLLDD